jgi:hypothetical protein
MTYNILEPPAIFVSLRIVENLLKQRARLCVGSPGPLKVPGVVQLDGSLGFLQGLGQRSSLGLCPLMPPPVPRPFPFSASGGRSAVGTAHGRTTVASGLAVVIRHGS